MSKEINTKKLAASGVQAGVESFKDAKDLTESFKGAMSLNPSTQQTPKNTIPTSGAAAMMPSSTKKESKN